MDPQIIPPSPNWYNSDILACAPDNTIIYGARGDLVVIKPTVEETKPEDIRIIASSHYKWINSVNINKNWGKPNKYAVSVSGEDKVVKVWNVESLQKICSHNKHSTTEDDSKLIGASFAGEERIISASENGTIILCNILRNEYTILSDLLVGAKKQKITLTTFSICPHANWLSAFGLKNGLITVVDLRKTGRVLYSLRGHGQAVVSLTWGPVPLNIFPIKPNNKIVEKKLPIVETNKSVLEADPDTPTDRRNISMDISYSTVKNDVNTIISEEDVNCKRKQEVPQKQLNLFSEFYCKSPRICSNKTNLFKVDDILLKSDSNLPESSLCLESASDGADTENLLVNNSDQEQKNLNTSSPQAVADSEKDLESEEKSPEIDESTKIESSEPAINNVEDPESEEKSPKIDESAKIESSESVANNVNDPESEEKSSEIDEFTQIESSESLTNNVKNPESEEKSPKSDESAKIESSECENWRKRSITVEEEEPRKEYLLASSARESKIYIWRAGTDGRLQTFLTLPSPARKNKKSKAKRSEDAWISLCWAAPSILLTSSASGELLQLNIPKPTIDNKQSSYVKLHTKHWKSLFCIKCPSFYFDEYNFKSDVDINVWTVGLERSLCNFNMKNKTFQNLYNTLGGNINCIAGSFIDSNTIALGTQDREIKLWNLSNYKQKIQEFKVFYDQIYGEVTALAWHPTIDGVLAWGTIEGRIGVTEVFTKKASKIVPHYFKNEIYKLEWGPNAKEDKFLLFAVSEGSVVIFDIDALKDAPQILTLPITDPIYTMAWKPDFSTLLISTSAQKFFKLTPMLSDPELCYADFRLEKIVWHSDAAEKRSEYYSKYSQVFAAVSKHSTLKIVDLSIVEEQTNKQILAQFTFPDNKIMAVQWNPFKKDHLVVVCSKSVASVLDIETKTVISTYINPWLDCLYSVYWSPANENLIVLGADRKLIVYNYLDYPALTETEIKTEKNRINKKIQSECMDLIPTANNNSNKPIKTKKVHKSNNNNNNNNNNNGLPKLEIVSLFYTIKEANVVKDLTNLLDWKLGSIDKDVNLPNSSSIDIFDIYGDQENLGKIFDKNFTSFKENKKYNELNTLALIQGDVSTSIKTAIEEKRVTPSIIAISPMISINLWKSACEVYTNQLLEDINANPLEVLNYLLICHKVEEALNYLCDKEMFREAFLLVKSRFGLDCELTNEILTKWSKNLIHQGNYELAACCCICTENYETAAQWLYRRNNLDILHIAVRLAKLCGNTSLCEAIETKLNELQIEEAKREIPINDDSIEKNNTELQEDGKDLVAEQKEEIRDSNGLEGENGINNTVHQEKDTEELIGVNHVATDVEKETEEFDISCVTGNVENNSAKEKEADDELHQNGNTIAASLLSAAD